MASPPSSAFADVYSAFSEDPTKAAPTAVAPAPQAAASVENPTPSTAGSETYNLIQVLQTMNAEGGRLPFSLFARQLPGDPVTSLASTVDLMKKGWVEFVGDINENSDVRLTDMGRDMLVTLKNSIAVS